MVAEPAVRARTSPVVSTAATTGAELLQVTRVLVVPVTVADARCVWPGCSELLAIPALTLQELKREVVELLGGWQKDIRMPLQQRLQGGGSSFLGTHTQEGRKARLHKLSLSDGGRTRCPMARNHCR